MEIYVFYKYIEIHGFIGKERNKVRLYGEKSKDIMLYPSLAMKMVRIN